MFVWGACDSAVGRGVTREARARADRAVSSVVVTPRYEEGKHFGHWSLENNENSASFSHAAWHSAPPVPDAPYSSMQLTSFSPRTLFRAAGDLAAAT